MLRRIGHRDDPAHRGTDQHKALDPERVDEGREIRHLVGVLIGAVGRPGALAMAAHIHRDEMAAVAEPPGHRVERLGARGVAVDAYDRQRAGPAPFQIPQGQAVDGQRLSSGLQSRRHGRSSPRSSSLILPNPEGARTYDSDGPINGRPSGRDGERGAR